MTSLLIQNGQIVTEDGVNQSDILIENRIVTRIAADITDSAEETIDAADLLIFPGLIDCHVHFRDPGNTEAEDMMSGAAAARNGGVTTVCEMPNTNPPTCTRSALKEKIEKAEKIRNSEFGIDIRFFFSVSAEEHLKELDMIHREDICGVKLYFDHSTGNLGADTKAIEGTFKLCAEKNIPVVCHCEDPEVNANAMEQTEQIDVSAHSENRPPESEMESIDEAIALSRKYGTQLHIAHLSTSFGLDLVRQAKMDALNITCEVAPHHLFLSVENYKTLGALAKTNPPLRSKDHCEALMAGVLDGSVDCIATDHAPHTLEAKRSKNPLEAPSGVPGVETMVPLLLNAGIAPQKILSLCHTLPNRIYSLGKPGLTVGKPADLALVNPGQTWVIKGAELKSKCGWTPYDGWKITGKVVRVI